MASLHSRGRNSSCTCQSSRTAQTHAECNNDWRLVATPTPPPQQVAVQQAPRESNGWNFNGALSQFYFHSIDRTGDDDVTSLSQSELLSQAIFSASRRGERFDLLVRGNLGYLHELSDKEAESQGRASYLYLNIKDNELGMTARLDARHNTGQAYPAASTACTWATDCGATCR